MIGLIPGSRRSIAQANFPRLLEVAGTLAERFPGARFLIPTTEASDPIVRRHLGAGGLQADRVEVQLGGFDQMVPTCDLCLTVSGTATLHVASHGVPMVVVYAGNPVLWNLLGRWLTNDTYPIRQRVPAIVSATAETFVFDP